MNHRIPHQNAVPAPAIPLVISTPSPHHGAQRKRAALPRLLSPSTSPLGFGGGVDGSGATFKMALLGLTVPRHCSPSLFPLPFSALPLGFGGGGDGTSTTFKIALLGLTPRPLTMGRKRAALPRLLSPSTSPLGFGGFGGFGGGVDGSSATFKIALLGLAACLFCLLILVIVVLFALLISMRWSSADVAASLAARESLTAEALRGRKAHPGMVVVDQQGMVPNTTAAAGSSSSQNPNKKSNNEGGAANNEDKDPAGSADDDDDDDDEAGGGGLSSRRKEGARKLQQWREFFRGVVLVLHFSRPIRAWQTLEFWRHVYGRVFDDLVAVSTEAIPELGVIAATPAANADPSLSYTALPTIMEHHASASGFLWLDDDAVLNYWTLADTPLDKNKIWYLNSSNPNHLLTLPLDQPPSAPIRTALDPSDLPTHISTSLSHLSESLRAQLDRSLWPRHQAFPLAACPSSAFFIPQRLVDSAALHVIPVFAAEAIPAQVACPSPAFSIPQRLVDSAALHVIPVFAAQAIPAQAGGLGCSARHPCIRCRGHTRTGTCLCVCAFLLKVRLSLGGEEAEAGRLGSSARHPCVCR
ncbi:unnamed protein product [Closterium sp. Naga37s-1]|nr:unnamed protein product [Closterium sp. Naga37s-1]